MIKSVFLQASYKLWFVYTILVVEYILYALMPWLLGKSIDSLIQGTYFYFVLYGIAGFFGLVIGIFRRRLDTRIFSNVSLNMTKFFLTKMFDLNLCSSKILVRIKKISMFTNFAEYTIPSVVKSTIYIGVSFACLLSTIGLWSVLLFAIMTMTILTSYLFASKIEKHIDNAQIIEEKKEKCVIERREQQAANFCQESTKIDIKVSDIQAANWGVVDFCCLICELCALLILTLTRTSTVGEIMSSLVYVQSLCGYFQVFPSIIEQLKHLKVASKYLKLTY
jgi:hypothetical protein